MDGTPPRIELSDTWYIWETGEVTVRDKESGLTGVEIEIRDPQNRWPKVSRAYEASGERFTITITWDRHFGDGTLAPIGAYEVVVKAFDRAGNMERVTAHILIPAPNVTPTPLPTRTPIPMATATATLPVSSSLSLPAHPAPTATRAPTIQSLQSPNLPIPQSSNPPSTVTNSSSSVPPSSFPLWGAAAAAAIGAATAYALEQRRKRKDEEARQLAEAQAEAARRNAAEEALKVRNWLMGQAMMQNALSQSGLSQREQEQVRAEARTKGVSAALELLDSLKQAAQARLAALEARITRMEERLDKTQQSDQSTAPSYPRRPLYPDPETADMTEAERLAEYKQSAAYQARESRYRQWEAQQAYLRYRQGEWADPQPQSKPWWQKVGIIRDLADSLPDGIDLVTGATSTARASWRLAFPSRFGSPLWEDIALEQFGREVRSGAITEKNILEELARLPNKNFRKFPLSYTDLAEAWDGARQVGGAAINLTPLGMQIGGMVVEQRNPQLGRDLQSGGNTLDGLLNLWQGAKQISQGANWLEKTLRSPFGKPLIGIQGAIGVYDYVVGASRLIFDPTIAPGASPHAWTERVGVATQAIGGVFLAAGAFSAFVPVLQPAAPIFLTAGVLFEGAGMIMQNWGWINEKATQLFGRP